MIPQYLHLQGRLPSRQMRLLCRYNLKLLVAVVVVCLQQVVQAAAAVKAVIHKSSYPVLRQIIILKSAAAELQEAEEEVPAVRVRKPVLVPVLPMPVPVLWQVQQEDQEE